jgi:predicted transcriptional regulator
MPDGSEHGPLELRVVSAPVPMKVTTVRLDDTLRDELRRQAELQGISEAELVRQAIAFYLGWRHAQTATPTDR